MNLTAIIEAADPFFDEAGTAYGSIPAVDDKGKDLDREFPLDSPEFRQWVKLQLHQQTGRLPTDKMTGTFEVYGKKVPKRYKTFEATWRPAGGAIRVVLADEPKGWVAFFCTDTAATAADILGRVADRFGLETTFRDAKGVVGAGRQQVRRVGASVGAFHVCLWAFTMTEAWAWERGQDGLVGHRKDSPWDDKPRRPSHADRRRAWRRALLAEEIRAALPPGTSEVDLTPAIERLLDLAA